MTSNLCPPIERSTFTEPERAAALRLIALALDEDLGDTGDITTQSLIPPSQTATVQIVSRAVGVLAGTPLIDLVLDEVASRYLLSAKPRCSLLQPDGALLSPGTVVADLSGSLASLLIAERTILNFLTHLCGVASLTHQFAQRIAGTRAKIYDTRKTLPGWRLLEKYAVRAGGGCNHRVGLSDMVLIKDNHLAGWATSSASHTIAAAVRAAREKSPPGIRIEVEVDTLEQLADALNGNPDIVLLDNMTCPQLREAVALRNSRAPRVELEASGGISLATVTDVASTGVERISIGAVTHSAVALDLAFDWKK